MTSKSNLVPLSDSNKSTPAGKWLGQAKSETPVIVTLELRCCDQAKLDKVSHEVVTGQRKPLTRREFQRRFGASKADVQAVLDFAAVHGLTLAELAPGQRRVQLAGTAAQMSAAFAVELHHYQHESGVVYRGRSGTIMLPENLTGIVKAVRNLDTRPQSRTRLRLLRDAHGNPARRQTSSFNPPDVAKLRNMPLDLSRGKGQTMAFVELGGGFRQEDLDAYFSAQGVPSKPRVVGISVDGATNSPSTSDSADGEVMADICVAASIAYEATFGVYFGLNTSDGFLNVTSTAIHDEQLKPSVVSISWGASKENFTAQDVQSWEDLGQAAATMGVTILVAAGDDGTNDNMNDGKAHVDWPSSSKWILSCGGTRRANGVDTVWGGIPNNGATGGGVDTAPVPDYQAAFKKLPVNADTKKKGRVCPDISDIADPQTGWNVRVDGEDVVIGGTSLVAPFDGAGIIILNGALGKPCGYLHPRLYAANFSVTTDVTEGSNGAYKAGKGIDACTGLGVVDFGKLFDYLQKN